MVRQPVRPSPATNVIVRVVVVHGGSGFDTNWITLVVAIAGLALSLASLGWQAFAFRRSGHRVRVRLVVGVLHGRTLGELIYKKYPSLELIDKFVKRGFDPVVTAVIRNYGRQAVTVEMCEWRTTAFGTAGTVAGDPLPKKLEAGASCKVAFYLTALLMLPGDDLAPEQRKWKIVAIIHLGTGERVRSKPLRVPLEAMHYRYPRVSARTQSGVGWPGDALIKKGEGDPA
jgi:hypothetical protein